MGCCEAAVARFFDCLHDLRRRSQNPRRYPTQSISPTQAFLTHIERSARPIRTARAHGSRHQRARRTTTFCGGLPGLGCDLLLNRSLSRLGVQPPGRRAFRRQPCDARFWLRFAGLCFVPWIAVCIDRACCSRVVQASPATLAHCIATSPRRLHILLLLGDDVVEFAFSEKTKPTQSGG